MSATPPHTPFDPRHEQPYQHGLYLLSVGLEARRWHVRDYEAVLPGVTVDSLRAFQSAMLGTVRIDALIAGNVPAADARALLQALEARLLAGCEGGVGVCGCQLLGGTPRPAL